MNEKTPEVLALEKYVTDMKARDVAVLGEHEVFLLKDSKGTVRGFRGKVRLSLADGTLCRVGFGDGAPVCVSAQGYQKLAEGRGATVMNAPHVLVDGVQQQNPHIVRDKATQRIIAIYCRSIAFEYSDKGIPKVSDRTSIFDVPSYRLIDLLGKAKKVPQAFRLLPKSAKIDEPGTWAKYPFDDQTDLHVNTSHPEALSFFAQIINREKKALDIAQTFSQRNALKHLTGIQNAPGNAKEWTVPVVCWRPTGDNVMMWSQASYANAQKQIEAMASGAEEAEIVQGTDYVHEENPDVIEQDIVDIEDRTADDEPAQTQPPAQMQEMLRQEPADPIWRKLDSMKQSAVSEYYHKALKFMKISEPETPKQAAAIIAAANEIMDKELA